MPVLAQIKKRFKNRKALSGVRISGCLHVTTETANLALTLKDGGADIVMCASNRYRHRMMLQQRWWKWISDQRYQGGR
jgi:S-adenosylhomocysteine hydrolase